MTAGKKRQTQKTGPQTKAATAVKQRQNSGAAAAGRDEKGRFAEGNPHSFQPGQSGNPAGRPKAVTLSEAYRRGLASPVPDDPLGRTYAEVIADSVIEAATKGNVKSAREIADRTEGRPRQALEVDLKLFDWRELARANGLNEQDVLNEAKRLIESAAVTSGAESD